MNKLIKGLIASVVLCASTIASADQVLIIDAQYSTVTQNVQGRLEAAGHTVTVTTSTASVPTGTGTYQQVWDLRYSAALTAGEVTNYTQFVTGGGFAYFVTENPGCCMARNNSVAALVTGLGGGSTQIGPGWADNVETNVNSTYMTNGITVNYLAVAAIVNSQGIPLISDGSNNVSGMSWIGRAGALSNGVTGTIVTVADTNWLAQAWGSDNQTALDDIIRGIVAGTVGGTISAQGNGAAASNGAAQQQAQNQTPPPPPTFDHANTGETVQAGTMASGTFTGDGGTLVGNGTTVANNIVLNSGGLTYDANGADSTLSGVLSGTGGISFTGNGITTISGVNTYTGATGILSGASLINSGDISSSSGVLNNGTFTNNGTTSGVVNYGVFTNTGTTGDWINYGTVTNSGSMGNGANYLTFTNTGTIGSFTNSSDLTNTGTAGAGINTGRLINSGAMGIVTNSGTFTNTGTLGGISNSGTWSTSSITLPSYTQAGTGSTVLDYSTRLRITGTANLDGNLTLLGTAPSLGKYSLISGNNINGAYSSYSGVGALRYTAADVQLWVMPSDSVVQRQVDTVSTTLGSMNALATSSMTGALGSDCASSSEGGCISVNYGATKVGGGDLNSAGITLVKSVNPNWRVGVFTNQQLNDATTPTTRYSSSRPAVGAMLGWSDSADNIGLGATVSVIGGSGDYTLGSDKTGVSSKAAQAKLTYSRPIDLDTTVTPYVGIRRSEFTVDGYITGDQLFPLTYSTVKQTSTDLLAGATVAHRISDNVLGTVNAGVVQNLARDLGTVNSTSDMGSHSAAIQGGSRISAALGAGISYAVDKNQRISFSTGWQQRGLTNAAVNSYGIGYTAGF